MSQSTESKLIEGTEILRTGGGVTLTARDCNVLLDLIVEANRVIRLGCPMPGGLQKALESVRRSER